jgi:hypothetical protein
MAPHPDNFRPLLQAFLDRGYVPSAFVPNPQGRMLMLRHDIDFSLEAALETAQIEHELGISATYFFMLSSNFYNPWSAHSRALVERVAALGHTISLHYDPTVHDDIDAGFALERDAFERLFGTPIEVVSLHRPRGFLEDNNRPLPGAGHTYESRWFKDIAYASDSAGSFRYGHPLDTESVREGRPLHLLLHPIWWAQSGETPSDKIRDWQRGRDAFLNEEAALNCGSYDRVAFHA